MLSVSLAAGVIPNSTRGNVAGAPVDGVTQAAANPDSMAVSPHGSMLYVVTTTSGQVIAVNTATDKASGMPMSAGPDPTQIVC